MKTKSKKFTPIKDITPAESIDRLRGLNALISNHRATADARRQELIDSFGSADLDAIVKGEPELLTDHGQDLTRMDSQLRLAESAAQGAERRVRELLPLADQHLWTLSERLAKLHHETRERITKAVRKRLEDLALFDAGDIERFIYRARPVREQAVFEAQHSATFSLSRINVKGGGSRLGPDVTARDALSLASRLETGIEQAEARAEQVRKTYK